MLNLWKQGKTDEAVECYFHLKSDRFSAAQMKGMEVGKEIHQEVEQYITVFNKFPDYLPKLPLTSPEPEKVVIVPYNEFFTIKAIYDVLDGNVLYELKTGVTDALTYAQTLQVPLYFLVAELAGIEIERAYLVHHNQVLRKNDFVIIWNNRKMRQEAQNLIDSLGPEIYKFFNEQGYL